MRNQKLEDLVFTRSSTILYYNQIWETRNWKIWFSPDQVLYYTIIRYEKPETGRFGFHQIKYYTILYNQIWETRNWKICFSPDQVLYYTIIRYEKPETGRFFYLPCWFYILFCWLYEFQTSQILMFDGDLPGAEYTRPGKLLHTMWGPEDS